MALVFEKEIDLTNYQGNPAPALVTQLAIVHEAKYGELVQYYFDPSGQTQGDKSTNAVGVYNQSTKQYDFRQYDQLVWGEQKSRITGNQIERLGVKAFPGIGSFAFYKLAYRSISRIVAPVNREEVMYEAPYIEAEVNADNSVTFDIYPPENDQGEVDETFKCYRIILRRKDGLYVEDHLTYELYLTIPQVRVSGIYECFAIGFKEEGQLCSEDSNVIELNLVGEMSEYRPAYTAEKDIQRGNIYGTSNPSDLEGGDGQIYFKYRVDMDPITGEDITTIVAQFTKIDGQWIKTVDNESHELPAGGSEGQALVKRTSASYDVKWGNAFPDDGLQTPIFYDLRTGYIQNGVWVPENPTNTYADVYRVTKDHTYFISLGGTVGSRFRAMFSEQNVIGATARITGTSIVNLNDPPAYSSTKFTVPENGYITIAKDNVGVSGLMTYVYDMTDW